MIRVMFLHQIALLTHFWKKLAQHVLHLWVTYMGLLFPYFWGFFGGDFLFFDFLSGNSVVTRSRVSGHVVDWYLPVMYLVCSISPGRRIFFFWVGDTIERLWFGPSLIVLWRLVRCRSVCPPRTITVATSSGDRFRKKKCLVFGRKSFIFGPKKFDFKSKIFLIFYPPHAPKLPNRTMLSNSTIFIKFR